MSDLFSVFSVSGSGLGAYQNWLDTISNNMANADDVSPTSGPAFRPQYVVAQSAPGGVAGAGAGVRVSGYALGSAAGVETYDPTNPLADAKGMVRRPDLDMSEQMTSMMMAQRGYEANLAVINRAQSAYEAALSIGRSS